MFTINPFWDRQGDAAFGAYANGKAAECRDITTSTRSACVHILWPGVWSAYDRQRSTFRESWHGSLLESKRDASGLQFRRNRFYDPSTGRFTQEDPIGLAGGINLYGFAEGDPVNFSDPFGLNPCFRSFSMCWQSLLMSAQRLGGGLQAAGRWVAGGWQRLFQSMRGAPSLPQLAHGPGIEGRHMLGEAVGHLRSMPGPQRADAFRNFAQQIGEATRGSWTATEMAASNARVFVGQAGEALVFDKSGSMFRGSLNSAAFVLQKGGEFLVNFEKLSPLH